MHLLKYLRKWNRLDPSNSSPLAALDVPYIFLNLQRFACHKLLYNFPSVEKEEKQQQKISN